MPSPQLILGIDAGGTSARVALARREDEQPLCTMEVTASSDGTPDVLLPLLPQLLASGGASSTDIRAVCAGITKFTRTGIARRWTDALTNLFPQAAVQIVPDYEIAFHGALPDGQGIMVVAGTGSVAFAANGNRTARVGGRGWEYGDEGSGAHLTTEAIRRTLRALDGMDPPCALTDTICALLETRDAAVLGETARQRAHTEGRGFLVPHLLQQARQGDPDARNLYVGAGGWLAALIRAGLTQVGISTHDAPHIATVGGLWAAGDLLSIPFARVVTRWYPAARIVPASESPLGGALRLARRSALPSA